MLLILGLLGVAVTTFSTSLIIYYLRKYFVFLLLDENQNYALAFSALTSAVGNILALFVSVVAVGIAFRTAKKQIKHNKLTVKPLPEITVDDHEYSLCIKLVNHGFGPLLINSFTSTNVALNKSGKSLAECVNLSGGDWTRSCGVVDGRVIPTAKEIVLVELIMEPGDSAFSTIQERARHDLSFIEIVLCYSDVYGSEFPLYKKRILLPDHSKYLE